MPERRPPSVRSLKFDVAVLSSSFDEANALADEISAAASWDDAQQLNTAGLEPGDAHSQREGQNHEQALKHCPASQRTDGRKRWLDPGHRGRVYYEAGDLEQAVRVAAEGGRTRP